MGEQPQKVPSPTSDSTAKEHSTISSLGLEIPGPTIPAPRPPTPARILTINEYYRTTTKPRSVGCKLWKFDIRFNPVVSVVSIVVIWGFVGLAVGFKQDMNDKMKFVKTWIRQTWTWLYVGSYNVWTIFIAVVYFSKYSAIKLGKDSEKPEYSDISYFTMLFAAGIGPGLFYFAVAEPVYHYSGKNRYTQSFLTDNEKAQHAMSITFLHWGVHGWSVYVLVGMLLALMAYRYDLNMTMRTCFFPLLGNRVQGLLGDCIDIFSVVCTMFGVCTSLGIGVMQLNGGLERVSKGKISYGETTQIILIWIITAMATLSVVTGMKRGIKLLSEICFVIGVMLMTVLFFYDDTFYILNAMVQNVGNYLASALTMGFTTDAHEQKNMSMDGIDSPDWMDNWTMFYWGWWVSWSPFVGMFIAKISRGRTIKDYIFYTLTVPCCYILVWFSVFGTIGIRTERAAYFAGLGCNTSHNLHPGQVNVSDGRLTRLSCRSAHDMLFDTVLQYVGLSDVLSIVTMCSLILYFVTSSDSGSMIIDCLTANGIEEPPMLQRIFWSVTEGATATALLIAGGKQALESLRAVALSVGLLYTIIMNLMCLAMWRSLRIEAGDISVHTPSFSVDMVEPFYSGFKLRKTLQAVFIPFWPLSRIAVSVYDHKKSARSFKAKLPYVAIMGIPFLLWVTLLAVSFLNTGLMYVGWTFYAAFVVYATGIRAGLREEHEIIGNIAEDFFSMLFIYPLAILQMDEQLMHIEDTQQYTVTSPAQGPGSSSREGR